MYLFLYTNNSVSEYPDPILSANDLVTVHTCLSLLCVYWHIQNQDQDRYFADHSNGFDNTTNTHDTHSTCLDNKDTPSIWSFQTYLDWICCDCLHGHRNSRQTLLLLEVSLAGLQIFWKWCLFWQVEQLKQEATAFLKPKISPQSFLGFRRILFTFSPKRAMIGFFASEIANCLANFVNTWLLWID